MIDDLSGIERIQVQLQRRLLNTPSVSDDARVDGLLVKAAALLLGDEDTGIVVETSVRPQDNPWIDGLLQQGLQNRLFALEYAGALIAAEINRLLRLTEPQTVKDYDRLRMNFWRYLDGKQRAEAFLSVGVIKQMPDKLPIPQVLERNLLDLARLNDKDSELGVIVLRAMKKAGK